VDAVVILGNDGLPIDDRIRNGLDAEVLAAHLPAILQACDELGENAQRGSLVAGVLEYDAGFAVVSSLTRDAKLLVLLRPQATLGPLLYDIRRHRAEIAALL
jgi:predicted regulator of Ras-like GTPase activity (Roadblock/LC7/MglB family)